MQPRPTKRKTFWAHFHAIFACGKHATVMRNFDYAITINEIAKSPSITLREGMNN
jgi:hypothetical protein